MQLFKLPDFSRSIWILAGGRLLSQIGSGLTLFYAPIFFVNQVGIPATLVGFAIGSASISGVFGRFWGGSAVDSPQWGRRKTLLLAVAISAVADVFLATTSNFPGLVLGNLLMGLGIGFYWPATEAAIIDLTASQQRNEAFAITRLADNLGLSLGVILGGALLAASVNYRMLFVIDGISFVLFFAVVYFAIAETYEFEFAPQQSQYYQGWLTALGDRTLMIYVVVNILFTTYLSQLQSTLPLYLKNFVSVGGEMGLQQGFSEEIISGLFTWHIIFAVICQLPMARFLNYVSRINALIISMMLWGIGFSLIWLTSIVNQPLICIILALGFMSLAMISYTPAASAFIADIAPESLRGVYLAINSQCWAIGYFIGPAIGGYALDQSVNFVMSYWLGSAISIIFGIAILSYLKKTVKC
ncbi:Major Facilitator Superfamily transporter [Xenococcus sp. PCC 7305]|uniref:MFS transporter n=1 Tax=Xenococcus sp. PCC 7305 TaxID=102125 RepID=UPI0002ABD56E|nr:MFS transporter [Xenococcus sp. PCC 7305]ELS03315.1 Major Facilitator Superfamily transporter [Xenococcus sp. PCC 7305]